MKEKNKDKDKKEAKVSATTTSPIKINFQISIEANLKHSTFQVVQPTSIINKIAMIMVIGINMSTV